MTRTEKVALGLGVGAGVWLARQVYRHVNQYDLRGKAVLITGGSRGLGLIMARYFLQDGARLALCARDAEELERARTELAQRGGEVLAVPCDVADPAQVRSMVDTVRRRFGRIDVLVNDAGIISAGPYNAMRLADYREAMEINFFGALNCLDAVVPEMQERKEGRIVNITSIGGKVSMPHLLPYNASKFALVGLSEGLRAELARDGITVTTVCPGLMRTGSPRQGVFKGNARAEYTWFALSDSVPGPSMSADRAARRIVKACKLGEAEVILSLPAKCAATFHGLFPGLTADLLGLVNRFLPTDANPQGVSGKKIERSPRPPWVTALTDRAARRNNEIAPGEMKGSRSPSAPDGQGIQE